MIHSTKKFYYSIGAAMTIGLVTASAPAHAANNFSSIVANIVASISNLPGLISGMAYLFGVLLGVLGVLKIKDHVENPTQTPLKDGAIRLACGGALFALPILFESMFTTIGDDGTGAEVAKLNSVTIGILGGP